MTAAISAWKTWRALGLTEPRAGAARGQDPGAPGRDRPAQATQSGRAAAGAVCGRSEGASTWPPRRGRRGGARLPGGGGASSRSSARSPASGARAGPGESALRRQRRREEEEEKEEGG